MSGHASPLAPPRGTAPPLADREAETMNIFAATDAGQPSSTISRARRRRAPASRRSDLMPATIAKIATALGLTFEQR